MNAKERRTRWSGSGYRGGLGAANTAEKSSGAAYQTGAEEQERSGFGRDGGAVEVQTGGVQVGLVNFEVKKLFAGEGGEGEGVGGDAVWLVDGAFGVRTGALGQDLGEVVEVDGDGIVSEDGQGDGAAGGDEVGLVGVVAIGRGEGAAWGGVGVEGDPAGSGDGISPDTAGADVVGGGGCAVGWKRRSNPICCLQRICARRMPNGSCGLVETNAGSEGVPRMKLQRRRRNFRLGRYFVSVALVFSPRLLTEHE